MPKTHIIIMKKSPVNTCFSRYMKEKIASNYELGFLHKNLINFLRVKFLTKHVREPTKTYLDFI